MAEKSSGGSTGSAAGKHDRESAGDAGGRGAGVGGGAALTVARVRGIVARVVWIVCLVLALVLAAAAFSFALEANEKNDLVQLVRDLADAFDLGFFDLDNPVKSFDDPNAQVKTALFNYGIAAVVYLIAGRFLERIIRP